MSSLSPRWQQLSQQRKAMYDELETVLEEEADPLASYDNLVRWTLQNYANHADSGLLELLEESVRTFKDDTRYKTGDLRYVKLWILFANYVDRPALIYEYMMEAGIGKPYALFFEEYAEALEREGRHKEADTVITLGIRSQAKPLKHLRSFQENYHARLTAGKSLPVKLSPFREGICPANLLAIRTDPLRNIAPSRQGLGPPSITPVPSTGQHDVSMTATHALQPVASIRPNPYAHLSAPPPPGKKPERLRFDLTLLLEPDGTEYNFVEARARHLGLLGKKWPPPPPPNAAVSSRKAPSDTSDVVKEGSVIVDFNDHKSKLARLARRQSVTVTINTKQALEDVFDMYNSPVKEEPEVIAVKRRKIDTPGTLQTPTPASSHPPVFCDENAVPATTKPRAFQPFVDQRRENITPGLLKFKPSMNKTPTSNAFTPNMARKALVTKELVTPVPAFKVTRPQENVVTPANSEPNPPAGVDDLKGIDVFGGDDVTTDEFTEEFTHPAHPAPPPRSFVPFVDGNTDNGPLPAPRSENPPSLSTSTTKILKFQVHRDENPPQAPAVRRSIVGERTSAESFFKPIRQEDQSSFKVDEGSQAADVEEEYQEAGDEYQEAGDEYQEAGDEYQEAGDEYQEAEDEYQEVDDEYQELAGRRFARRDRFANFDLMTPITERTLEFTTSTRAIDTPGHDRMSMLDKGFLALDAQDVAEQLAAELQEEEVQDLNDRIRQDAAAASQGQVAILGPDIMDVAGVDENKSNYAGSSFEQIRVPFRVSDGFTIEPGHRSLLSSAVVVDSTTSNVLGTLADQSALELPAPCNPSDPDIISGILSLLPIDSNHRDLRHRIANNLNTMQRFTEKRARKGRASSGGRVSNGSDRLRLELDGDMFEVFEKLGEGGFGAVFMAKILNKERNQPSQDEDEDGYEDGDESEDDSLVALKVVRPTNLWESYMLRRIISAVPEDLHRSIIRPHHLYAFKDESFLVLDLCQHGTLLEIVNRAPEARLGHLGGGMDELLVIFFTVELLRLLQGLHDHGFIHGDLKIDNCLIRLEEVPGGTSAWSSVYNPSGDGGWASKGIKLIDFGRTIDTKLYPPNQTFVADWKTDARDCSEMREGRPWTFQTDYSGLASIIYCMLFGKYIETVEVVNPEGLRKVKPSQSMKRYWQVDLWNRIFDILLNPCHVRPDGSLPITDELVPLRRELETWLQANCNEGGKSLKGMLKKIEIVVAQNTV